MGKKGDQKDKAAPSRRQSSKSNIVVPEESQTTAGVPSGASWNAGCLENYHNAIEELLGYWENIAHFDPKMAKMALVDKGVEEKYRCSNNLFRSNLRFNVDPNVPIRQSAIDSIIAYYYEQPATFQETYECVVSQAWANDVSRMKTNAGDVHPVVPVEHIMAFVLAARRDIGDEEKMKAWKFAFLTVSFSYHVCSDADAFWMAQNSRQAKKHADMTMTLTCLQKIFSVLNHKARLEKANGGKEMGVDEFCKLYEENFKHANENERVSDSFVDTALTMGKRVLKDEKLANLLLKADEHPRGSPFDQYTKLQLLIQKGKWDGYVNKWLGSEYMSQRALKGDTFPGGTGGLLIGMLEMKKVLLTSSVGLLGCMLQGMQV
ncbi:Gyltl1b [Symbiodinium sp. CCMP2592]|nr:Gyltl1b [Symbiodinium sp. CCMP2592]